MIRQSISSRLATPAPYPQRRYAPPMPALDPDALTDGLRSLPGWEVRDGALWRSFGFPDFTSAMAFANRVAAAAEDADHHPDMLVGWGKVELSWVTHSEGGITASDLQMAATSDRLATAGAS